MRATSFALFASSSACAIEILATATSACCSTPGAPPSASTHDPRVVGERRHPAGELEEVARLGERVLLERLELLESSSLARLRQFRRRRDQPPRARIRQRSDAARAACPRCASRAGTPRRHCRQRFVCAASSARMPAMARSEQRVELRAIERAVLAGPLHLDELPFTAHHDVHVDFGPDILLIVEIESRFTIDHTDAHRRDASLDRRVGELARRAPASRTHRRPRRTRR